MITIARSAVGVALVAALGLVGCTKVYNGDRTSGGGDRDPPAGPSPIPPTHTVEFRAVGTVLSATLSYGSAQDGTTDTATVLPWSASIHSKRDTLFVFIRGQSFQFGTLRVQIFVDGSLFREAGTDGLTVAPSVSASGTVELSQSVAGQWRAVTPAHEDEDQ